MVMKKIIQNAYAHNNERFIKDVLRGISHFFAITDFMTPLLIFTTVRPIASRIDTVRILPYNDLGTRKNNST